MLGVTRELKESRFYKDIKEEGKAEVLMQTIPLLLQAGVSVQAIAAQLDITIAQVQAFSKAPKP